MTMTIAADPVPLLVDENGTIRVKGSRVTLENVIAAYQQGLNAEEIVQEFPTLELANVHIVLGYYLHHRDEIEKYLKEQDAKADEVRQKIEADYPTADFRSRMIALRDERRRQQGT